MRCKIIGAREICLVVASKPSGGVCVPRFSPHSMPPNKSPNTAMDKKELVATLHEQLAAVKAERALAKADPATLAARTALKRWQSRRLSATHADLLASDDTGPAALFFLDELYGFKDATQRDIDVGRIVPTLERLMTYDALHTITQAIMLDALSEALDAAMAQRLGEHFGEAEYLQAFREVTTPESRGRQVELVRSMGLSLARLVRIPLLSMTLRVMAGPARLAGLQGLHDFLLRGFTTFKKMREPVPFIDTIVAREAEIIGNIFADLPQPFRLGQRLQALPADGQAKEIYLRTT